jgi:glycosyltransferase involved in cell wall biosynthesis
MPLSEASRANGIRIAVQAHSHIAGGLSVGKNLVAALGRVGPENTFLISVPQGVGYEDICHEMRGVELCMYDPNAPLLQRWYYNTFTFPRLVRRFKPDVFLGLTNHGLMNVSCPQVIYCQDAHYFCPRQHFSKETVQRRLIKYYGRHRLSRELQNASLVLCQTQVAARQFQEYYRYTGPMDICPNAVSLFIGDFQETNGHPNPLDPYGGKFKLLCLSQYYPHKNLEIILEVFSRFRDELDGCVAVLTIAPEQHRRAAQLLDRIRRAGLAQHIVNVGPIPQSELGTYFKTCQALLLPTLLESFSGTYLEAMHYGVPVLTSDRDFAHAACGEAALYFDPRDPDSINDAILRIRTDVHLSKDLSAKGRARLKSACTTWDEIAERMLARTYDVLSMGIAE